MRISCPEGGPFVAAGTQPVGLGGVRPADRARPTAGGGGPAWAGPLPVRFPSERDPGDAGWHIEASYAEDGNQRVNYRSRARGLLALYLLTDVDEASAPTRLRPGSHLDAARVLAPAGDAGMPVAGGGAGRRGGHRAPAHRAGHRAGGRRLPLPPVPGARGDLAAPRHRGRG